LRGLQTPFLPEDGDGGADGRGAGRSGKTNGVSRALNSAIDSNLNQDLVRRVRACHKKFRTERIGISALRAKFLFQINFLLLMSTFAGCV
jgi:hypothetical protein